jgi:hypothetical protein
MENVFEPQAMLGNEVFEPTSNFAGKKTPQVKNSELSNMLQQLKNVSDIEKVRTAVETGGLTAGLFLAKRFLDIQNSKFYGDDYEFAGEELEFTGKGIKKIIPKKLANKIEAKKKAKQVANELKKTHEKVKEEIKKTTETPTEKKEEVKTDVSLQAQAGELPTTQNKIFGLPKKVVIGGGIALLVLGVAGFFFFKKGKKK